MSNKRRGKKLWPYMVISAFVLITAILWCVYYFSSGKNLKQIDMPQYALVERTEDGGYVVEVNLNKLLSDLYLPNPYLEENSGMNIADYPDVQALSTLSFVVEQADTGYRVRTASTMDDIVTALKNGGYVLINTEWTWTDDDIVSAYERAQEYPRKLSMKNYVNAAMNADGAYALSVNAPSLLLDCGWILADDQAGKEAHTGYRAVMSLGFLATKVEAGYQIDTTSTIQNVVELLAQNGIELTDTSWIWTVDEVQSLYTEQGSIQLTPEPSPSQQPTVTPDPQVTVAPSQSAGANVTPSAAASPVVSTDKEGCLSSLRGYDQLTLRRAIHDAKLAHYGNKFDSSEVLANYFFVASGDSAEYANCFRILYTVKTTNGTEYLTADVYNINTDDAITKQNVVLKSYTSKTAAADLTAFPTANYVKNSIVGGSMVYSEDGGASAFDTDGRLFSDSLTRKLNASELWSLPTNADMTLVQLLGYARNEIFAMAGNKYTSGKYYQHFSKYDWYKPTGSMSYNDIEAKYPSGAANITLIKELERLIKEG